MPPAERVTKPPRGLRLARIAGIELRADPTWFLSLALFAGVAHDLVVPDVAANRPWTVTYPLAVALALPIYVSIVLHELAHSFVALAHGIPVPRITLFIFGGVSHIEKQARSPGIEYLVALAGPLTSLLLAGVLAAVARQLEPGVPDLAGPWGFYAKVNLGLAAFNLIPAFPLDGGRILRSGLWRVGDSRASATRWAARIGATVALLFVGGGVGWFLRSVATRTGDAGGLWLALLGVFLFTAAQTAGRVEGGDPPNDPPATL